MKKAYVENGVVIEAVENPAVFVPDYAVRFTLDCPDAVTAGWTFDGAVWEPPKPLPPSVPTEISNWQAKKQLLIEGVYEQVNAAIGTMDADAQVDWNHAAVFRRNYPLILQMQALLGRTDADTDAYFIAASKLQ